MDLYRPFLAQRTLESVGGNELQVPQVVFVLSFTHLRALTQHYHASFSDSAFSRTIAWIHGPLYVASAIINYENAASRSSSFVACMEAFHPLLESHAIVETFVKGLYSMAVQAGVLSVVEAGRLIRAFLERKKSVAVVVESLETSVVLDQELAMDDPIAAIGDRLAQALDDMLLFENYVNDEPVGEPTSSGHSSKK